MCSKNVGVCSNTPNQKIVTVYQCEGSRKVNVIGSYVNRLEVRS